METQSCNETLGARPSQIKQWQCAGLHPLRILPIFSTSVSQIAASLSPKANPIPPSPPTRPRLRLILSTTEGTIKQICILPLSSYTIRIIDKIGNLGVGGLPWGRSWIAQEKGMDEERAFACSFNVDIQFVRVPDIRKIIRAGRQT